MTESAYDTQTFGKSLFRSRRQEGKSENSRVFIDDLMVGLGGLEPPTSHLSGARSSHLSYRPVVKLPAEGDG